MVRIPEIHNVGQWLKDNAASLKPPVNNQVMWKNQEDFIVQVVGGPNERTDYHREPYEEVFYQIKGDMHVNLMTEDGPVRVDIREGESWILPRNVPHSPQRPDPDSLGVVIERIREEGTLEAFQWYCLNCNNLVHEVTLQVRDIVKDLPPAFEEFYNRDEAGKTCSNCGEVHPGRG